MRILVTELKAYNAERPLTSTVLEEVGITRAAIFYLRYVES